MIKDSDWTPFYCNVTHKVIDGIQYSITNYGNFAQLQIYSWHTHRLVDELYFFKQKLGKDCHNEKVRFWNCGSSENAIKWAKHFVDGCESMKVYKNDLSRLFCEV